MPRPLRILVSGRIAGAPHQGGAAWAALQYVLGLRRLGHQVWFAEPVLRQALRPPGTSLGESENAAYFQRVMSAFGLEDQALLLDAESLQTSGPSQQELLAAAGKCDLLVNLSGLLRAEPLLSAIPVRLYLDLDPAFTQLWQHAQGIDMGFSGHTHFATVGLALGQQGCDVPLCGRDWISTLQPLVLEHWPQADSPHGYGWTTVANWRSYGSIEYQGRFYGQRAHSWRDLMSLPGQFADALPGERLQPAVSIHPGEGYDLARLADCGWELVDTAQVAGEPDSYRRFIQQSRAELGIAKGGYATSRCGWFSDRSICYLASGRPVVAQDTGFADFLPCGEGLFSFRTVEDVLGAAAQVCRHYRRHSKAARQVAVQFFDSDRVLTRLLKKVGFSP